jgi:hypothetical protein
MTPLAAGIPAAGAPLVLRPGRFSALRELFSGGFAATDAPLQAWYDLVPGGASRQPNCNLQGVNVELDFAGSRVTARLGLITNQEDDCWTPDAMIGVGADMHWGVWGNSYRERWISSGNWFSLGCHEALGNCLPSTCGSARPCQTMVGRFVVSVQRPPLPMCTTLTPSPSAHPYCAPSLFRQLPRMDLVGTLVGTALSPGSHVLTRSEAACREACCDAPFCDGFAFASGDAVLAAGGSGGPVSCFLYANVTQLIPSSAFTSGLYESTL